MGSNTSDPDDIQAVEGDILRMWEICDNEGIDHIFTIEEMVRARNNEPRGGGRKAFTEAGYKSTVIPKLLRLQFIEMISHHTFRLTDVGKAHCKQLRENGKV